MKPMIALYAGYFDPFTLGHLNIVRRAEKTFDKVVVAVAADSPKKAVFTADEREKIMRTIFKNSPKIQIDRFDGLLIDYAKRKEVKVVLRGIRTVSDFEYEYQMALSNHALSPDIETLFMMTEGEYSYISSTLIKEVARLGGDVSHMVPSEVVAELKKKYAS